MKKDQLYLLKQFTPLGFIRLKYPYWRELQKEASMYWSDYHSQWIVQGEQAETKRYRHSRATQANKHLGFLAKTIMVQNRFSCDLEKACNLLIGKDITEDVSAFIKKPITCEDLHDLGILSPAFGAGTR